MEGCFFEPTHDYSIRSVCWWSTREHPQISSRMLWKEDPLFFEWCHEMGNSYSSRSLTWIFARSCSCLVTGIVFTNEYSRYVSSRRSQSRTRCCCFLISQKSEVVFSSCSNLIWSIVYVLMKSSRRSRMSSSIWTNRRTATWSEEWSWITFAMDSLVRSSRVSSFSPSSHGSYWLRACWMEMRKSLRIREDFRIPPLASLSFPPHSPPRQQASLERECALPSKSSAAVLASWFFPSIGSLRSRSSPAVQQSCRFVVPNRE